MRFVLTDGVELHVRAGAASFQPSQLARLVEAARQTLGLQTASHPSRAMVTFHPQPLGIPSRGNEMLFLLDCSGSLQGDSMAQARRALALCVRALAQALGRGKQRADWRAQPPQRVGGRQRTTTADRLFDLLMTQQADGSFRLFPVLQQWLGQRWPAVKATAEQHGEALVATVVAVALLAQEAADRTDERGPAVAKAQHWLVEQGHHIQVEAWL